MQLNLPILHLLENSENILIAGAGGGFDIFAGLPIYFTLKEMGKNVHLANYSFTPVDLVSRVCKTETLVENELEGATADFIDDFNLHYYPEGYLSRWFKEVADEDVTIWMFSRNGGKRLRELYQVLHSEFQFDAIIMIDGGVDSLMRGNEYGTGTLVEDTVSMSAIRDLDIPVKILACLGFGSELEVCHHNALFNMARLTKDGAFYGSCALVKGMPVYQQYEEACLYVWEQPTHSKSHINMRVVSATQGEFGNYHMYTDYRPRPVFVSPLMSLYWFYDAQKVVDSSLIADDIAQSDSMEQAFRMTTRSINSMKNQLPKKNIPY
jgi:hypothetical protein